MGGGAVGDDGRISGTGASLSAATWAKLRSARTPRPTRTPHRKITTDTTVAAMKRNTNCLPFSWISWKPSSVVCEAMRAELYHSVREVQEQGSMGSTGSRWTALLGQQVEDAFGFGRLRVESQRACGFRSGEFEFVRVEVGLSEHGVCFSSLVA